MTITERIEAIKVLTGLLGVLNADGGGRVMSTLSRKDLENKLSELIKGL